MYSLKIVISLLSGIYSKVGLLDHIVVFCFFFFFRKLCTVFYSGCSNVHSYTQCTGFFVFCFFIYRLPSSHDLMFDNGHLTGVR